MAKLETALEIRAFERRFADLNPKIGATLPQRSAGSRDDARVRAWCRFVGECGWRAENVFTRAFYRAWDQVGRDILLAVAVAVASFLFSVVVGLPAAQSLWIALGSVGLVLLVVYAGHLGSLLLRPWHHRKWEAQFDATGDELVFSLEPKTPEMAGHEFRCVVTDPNGVQSEASVDGRTKQIRAPYLSPLFVPDPPPRVPGPYKVVWFERPNPPGDGRWHEILRRVEVA